MSKSKLSIYRFLKALLLSLVLLHLFVLVGYFGVRATFSGAFASLGEVSVAHVSDGYLLKVEEVDVKRRDIYLKVSNVPSELRMSKEDHGKVSSRIVCDGKITAQESVGFRSPYGYTEKSIYLTVLHDVSVQQCDLEVVVHSKNFAEYVGSMELVRDSSHEILGLDMRNHPIPIGLLFLWVYLSAWFFSLSAGTPIVVSSSIMVAVFVLFLLAKRNK